MHPESFPSFLFVFGISTQNTNPSNLSELERLWRWQKMLGCECSIFLKFDLRFVLLDSEKNLESWNLSLASNTVQHVNLHDTYEISLSADFPVEKYFL